MSDDLKARALRLLARREHTRAELARKLAPLAASPGALEALLVQLEAHRQLSDERCAEERARKLARKYGALWIRGDLSAKGVPQEIVERIAAAVPKDELERACAILARKYASRATSRKELAKRVRFLLSRGYSQETVREAMQRSHRRPEHGSQA